MSNPTNLLNITVKSNFLQREKAHFYISYHRYLFFRCTHTPRHAHTQLGIPVWTNCWQVALMFSFETKVWFTSTLPETPAFSTATTNLSFPPCFCRLPPPTFIPSALSLLHFSSIAPHYFAKSLSPPSPLWCFCASLSLVAAQQWLSRHPFNVWWTIFHTVEECVHACTCGGGLGSYTRKTGRTKKARAQPLRRPWNLMCQPSIFDQLFEDFWAAQRWA